MSTDSQPKDKPTNLTAEASETDLPGGIEFDQIQGNSIGGFSKDSQAMLFLRMKDVSKACATLRGDDDEGILADVAASNSEQVLRFNAQFKQLRKEGVPEGLISATWTNLVFTPAGLLKLGKPQADLDLFPEAFRQGMKARAGKLGDTGNSDPQHWEKIVDWDGIDAVLIVASDKTADALPTGADGNPTKGRIARYLELIQGKNSGLELCAPADAPKATETEGPGQIYGMTREDDPGHEHFGFKDGVSQPGIRGVNIPDDPVSNPDQGNPGQDLLHPGEFIIGYPRQQAKAMPDHDGPNPQPSAVMSGQGPISDDPAIDPLGSRQKLPLWAKNGSFLVFRRLEQDVLGFRAFIQSKSSSLGISEDIFGAKLVGRYKSGAPLEKRTFQGTGTFQEPAFDPGKFFPELGDSDTLNNNFEYGDDPKGEIVPLAAHIRKAYPRDEVPVNKQGEPTTEEGNPLDAEDSESRVQTHRLLRRGIPYGRSLFANRGGAPSDRRGLLFLAYQSDIERQFEFVQAAWVNNENFPAPKAGEDPIITPQIKKEHRAPISMCPFHKAEAQESAEKCPVKEVKIHHFVTTRGGGYFFSPSIGALQEMLKAQ